MEQSYQLCQIMSILINPTSVGGPSASPAPQPPNPPGAAAGCLVRHITLNAYPVVQGGQKLFIQVRVATIFTIAASPTCRGLSGTSRTTSWSSTTSCTTEGGRGRSRTSECPCCLDTEDRYVASLERELRSSQSWTSRSS